jgi:hypothetical protein
MKLSADTEAVVAYLQAYASNSLRKPGDLGVILELAAQHDAAEFANEIIFAGASLWRVYRIWKRLAPGQEGTEASRRALPKALRCSGSSWSAFSRGHRRRFASASRRSTCS